MWSFRSAERIKHLRHIQKEHLKQKQTAWKLSNHQVNYITPISYMLCIELYIYIVIHHMYCVYMIHIHIYIYITVILHPRHQQTQLHWPGISMSDIRCARDCSSSSASCASVMPWTQYPAAMLPADPPPRAVESQCDVPCVMIGKNLFE